jgi:hypothetical protein
MAGNQYLLSDAINDRAARAGDRHWRRSSLCIILRSTLELRTQMPRGSETPTRLPQFLDDTRAYCWSRQDIFIVRPKLCSRAFLEQAVTLAFEPRWPEIFRIEPPTFRLHAWLPGPDSKAWLLTLYRWGSLPGPYAYGCAETTPAPL